MSDLDLSLSVDRQKIALGEHVEIVVKVRNQTSKMVPFPNLGESSAPQPVYQIKGPDGKVVTYDPTRPKDREKAERDQYFHWLFPLQPGATMTGELLIQDAVSVSLPGEYVVSARFKWRAIDLEAEPVSFTLAAIRFSGIMFADNLAEPGMPVMKDTTDPKSWGFGGHDIWFGMVDGPDGSHVGRTWIDWVSPKCEPSMHDYLNTEWPLAIGGASVVGASQDTVGGKFNIQAKDAPAGGKIIPTQCASREMGYYAPHSTPYLWTAHLLKFGWEIALKDDSFEWFESPSPKLIAQGLRVLFTGRPRTEKSLADVFVVFAGETAELGHLHIEGVYEKPTLSALRTIAALGPGWVAAQAIIGPKSLGDPKIIASIARHASGTQVTFLRVDSTGAILARAERVLEHVIPIGPVAMQVRARNAEVEAAFPVKDARSGALHVVRVKAPVGLDRIVEPVVLPPIVLPEPTPTMLVAFSWFGAPFPQGVGLLLRQSGDKAFFWTEQRGLKSLPFTLHDQDEALILGKRSSWYVLVNTGIQIRSETVESFYEEYRPRSLPEMLR